MTDRERARLTTRYLRLLRRCDAARGLIERVVAWLVGLHEELPAHTRQIARRWWPDAHDVLREVDEERAALAVAEAAAELRQETSPTVN